MEINKPQTILIVEDDVQLSTALQIKFIDEQFNILAAGDGAEGLSVALNDHPDIILLDLIIPKMDGMTMLKKLREDEWGKKVPVIILSNTSPENSTQLNDFIVNHPSFYLNKSQTSISEIAQKVKEYLNKEG